MHIRKHVQKGGFFIYSKMQAEYQKITSQISELDKQIEGLPRGNLICARNGKQYKWYESDGHPTYIPKKDRTYAERLALKKYLTSLSEDLSHEQRAIQCYLNHHSDTKKSEQLLENEEFKSLLSSYFIPISTELTEWMYASYERNPKHPEKLIHKSLSGNLVRSKSESMIDTLLYANKIPFRYENLLQLGEAILYPDFTIRHPKTGMLYYWEHFGLMDNSTYAQNACSKLQIYTSFGIIPSIQLITTYETKDNPISIDMIEKIITYYFL